MQVAGAQLLSKIAILGEEFDAAEPDAVGIREVGAASADVRLGLHYERYVGAADGDGCHGCDVWLGRSLRIKMQAHAALTPRITWVVGLLPQLAGPAIYMSAPSVRTRAQSRS